MKYFLMIAKKGELGIMNLYNTIIKKLIRVIESIINLKILNFLFIQLDLLYSSSTKNMLYKQHKLLKNILRYASKHSKYYRQLMSNRTTKTVLDEYPFLTKKVIRENYEDLISDKQSHMIFWESYTGGSTGEPLKFLNQCSIDGRFQQKMWRRMGYKKGDIILAMDGTKIDKDKIEKGIYWCIKSNKQLPYGGYALSSLYLNSNNIQAYVDYICELQPSFIRGYPAFIYSIASYIVEHNIKLHFKIKGIQLTSESSYGYQHEIIKKAFNTKIFLQYGHTECCVFGYTFDESLRYRVEPLYGYVEIIKDNGELAKPGEAGEVIVTTLHNYIMPLIRYRTGDYAVFGGKDKNGIILNSVLGRTQDYIYNIEREKVLLTALIFGQHFHALGKIQRWQIEQFEYGKVVMHIIPTSNYSSSDEDEIRQLFLEKGHVECIFDYVDTIPTTMRGKSMMLNQHL
jgi:phenylacetate-CoA ligase